MKYELEVCSDSAVRIKKIRELPQWESEMVYDNVEALLKYLTDYVDLQTDVSIIRDLLNSAAMDKWIEFE